MSDDIEVVLVLIGWDSKVILNKCYIYFSNFDGGNLFD